ncbi:diguanylate phosphodiesterase [Pseudomonas alloputida]|uniref:Diguanylate phosphodiesterase n=2 Tax=Pseudomonas TaxID=286 RepID=A0ABD6N308_9PSED|nr:diguanylate phosphodiesterase [Pseudomonas hunanensis]TRZ63356.1 diguanylate phosphodiesterase [Pseudomonas alloputida]
MRSSLQPVPANTVAAATVIGGGRLASRTGLFAGEPAPTRRAVSNHRCVSTANLCRSGFTREYGSGGNGGRRVEIGQQGRPLRG